jgi:hypothetical protein
MAVVIRNLNRLLLRLLGDAIASADGDDDEIDDLDPEDMP